MQLDLSKTSTLNPRTIKSVTIDIEQNIPKKPCCPACKHEEFEGFSTGYGPFRRCKKCKNEWGAGGMSSMVMLAPEEKEEMKDFQAGLEQEVAYNEAMALGEANDLIAANRMNEKTSGSNVNRSLWNEQLVNYFNDYDY